MDGARLRPARPAGESSRGQPGRLPDRFRVRGGLRLGRGLGAGLGVRAGTVLGPWAVLLLILLLLLILFLIFNFPLTPSPLHLPPPSFTGRGCRASKREPL